MIRECHIDCDLNSLQAHFAGRVVFQPPAPAADLATLEERLGPLPRGVVHFLVTTNGLRLQLDPPGPFATLWSTHDMLQCINDDGLPPMPDGFMPICGLRDGLRDWLAVSPDGLHGIVVRCDPAAGDESLLASSFEVYLNAWTAFHTAHYTKAGRIASPTAIDAFDAAFISQRDDQYRKLVHDGRVQALLGELRMTIAGGADFE